MLKKLLKDIFNQKGIYTVLGLGIVSQIGFLTNIYIIKIYIEHIQNKNLNSEFWTFIYIGCFIIILTVFLGIYKDYLKKGIISKFEIQKSIYYYKKFFLLDYEYRNTEGTGKTITKVNRGIEAQTTLFNSFFDFIIIFSVRIIFISTIIFTLYKPLIGFFIILGIFSSILNKSFSKKIKILTDEEQQISENISRQTNKMIMESNLIKISNKQNNEIDFLSRLYSKIPKLKQNIFLQNDILNAILSIIFHVLEILCYAILGTLVIKSQMSIGELIITITYIFRIWWPIEILMNNISEYRNQISKYEALENFINQPNKIIDGEKDFTLDKGEIVFDKIDFGYSEDKSIFKDFSLKIDGGKTFALVGHSGSGKSTLIKLILKNYLVNSGSIKIDGQDIVDLKVDTFYNHIGYLSQEPAVFDGTIKQNLEYGLKEELVVNAGMYSLQQNNEEKIWEALKNVDLYDLVKESKEGLSTEIGEKGLKLSGGEKQRLAIARIFLKNPKILILDEPTSALDSISENKITNIINKAMENRTVIVIAHRLQTVMEANKIVVIEKGKVVETGNHSELLKQKGIYSSLVDLQRGVINE